MQSTATAQVHPVLAACQRAPVGEPCPPEVQAEIDAAMAEIADGTAVLVPHAEVGTFLEKLARES